MYFSSTHMSHRLRAGRNLLSIDECEWVSWLADSLFLRGSLLDTFSWTLHATSSQNPPDAMIFSKERVTAQKSKNPTLQKDYHYNDNKILGSSLPSILTLDQEMWNQQPQRPIHQHRRPLGCVITGHTTLSRTPASEDRVLDSSLKQRA